MAKKIKMATKVGENSLVLHEATLTFVAYFIVISVEILEVIALIWCQRAKRNNLHILAGQ